MKITTPIDRPIVMKRPLAFVDLETTGRTVGVDRIVEVGVLKVTSEQEEIQYDTRINPEMPITSEATKIHGISDRDVQNKPTFKRVAPRLLDFLEGCDLAGYNILNFDLPMLDSEFRRVGVPFGFEGRQVVDVMSIYVQKEPRDLHAAYRFYCGSQYEQAHSAAGDARACWKVLQGQLRMYADLPNTPEGLSVFVAEHKRTKTLDSGNWFETRDGQPAFARGRYRGMLILDVAHSAPEYLQWMLSTGLPSDTIKVIKSILPTFGE